MRNTTPLTILQISDLHIRRSAEDKLMGVKTELYWRRVFELAIKNHPSAELIILSGDLAQDPDISCYQRILKTLSDTSIPCICQPGNHDDYPLMRQTLNKGNVSCNKQVVFEHWQIISLNSQISGAPGGYLSGQELDFLEQSIGQHPELHVFLTFHHHCITTGSQWMDAMQIQNSGTLFKCLAKFPQVRLISYGHVHQQMHNEKNGIDIYSAPSTCFQFKPFTRKFALDTLPPGYRWFQLDANGKISSRVERLKTELHELDFQSGGY